MRRRIVPLVATVVATAALAAGCGVTDAEVRPGVAVSVDGRTLSLSTVDEVVKDYCALRAANAQAQAVPTVAVRADFARAWAQSQAVAAIAPEYGVRLPPSRVSRAQVEAAWQELGRVTDANESSLAFLTRIQQRLNDPLIAIGTVIAEREGKNAPSLGGDPRVAQGLAIDRVEKWLKENRLELNPVFGTFDPATGAYTGDPLSVPVSSEAKAKDDTKRLTGPEAPELTGAERCGPEAGPAAPPLG